MLFCFESAIPENAVNQMNDALVHEKRNRQRRLRRTHHHRRRILPRWEPVTHCQQWNHQWNNQSSNLMWTSSSAAVAAAVGAVHSKSLPSSRLISSRRSTLKFVNAASDCGEWSILLKSACRPKYCTPWYSQPKPTRAPRRLIVPSCRRWKHTTILRMVIIDFIAIMSILDIIVFKCDRSSLEPVLFPPDIFFYLRWLFGA